MKNFKSACISTIIVELVIVLMTVYSELSSGFKDILTSMSGHHWASKGIISLVLFFALYFMHGNTKSKNESI